jgi:hypothetical protein
VEVKIGVQNASRELVIDSEQSSDEVESLVGKALAGDDNLLVLADSKGRRLMIPADKLAYVEVGTSVAGQVGFRT